MSGIFEKLRQAANDTADHLTSMISELDYQIAQLHGRKKNIETERMKARWRPSAVAASYRYGTGLLFHPHPPELDAQTAKEWGVWVRRFEVREVVT